MKRRAFLKSLAATALASSVRTIPAYAVPIPKMKITRVRAYLPPHPNPLFNQSDVVVTIETDAGITGIGEGGMKVVDPALAADIEHFFANPVQPTAPPPSPTPMAPADSRLWKRTRTSFTGSCSLASAKSPGFPCF